MKIYFVAMPTAILFYTREDQLNVKQTVYT